MAGRLSTRSASRATYRCEIEGLVGDPLHCNTYDDIAYEDFAKVLNGIDWDRLTVQALWRGLPEPRILLTNLVSGCTVEMSTSSLGFDDDGNDSILYHVCVYDCPQIDNVTYLDPYRRGPDFGITVFILGAVEAAFRFLFEEDYLALHETLIWH